MKLIVQIPCYNEAESIARTVADVPRMIAGVSGVEVIVVDDGSTDGSADLALSAGADHVVRHTRNKGLAETFRSGLAECLRRGADIIVNFDGDGQYRGEDIERLIAPVLAGQADMVIGNRQIDTMPSYTPGKRLLHRMGRRVVNGLGRINISDPVSGFRALNREAALLLNILSTFSYTTETLIQAGHHRLRITEVPVQTNRTLRPSRLFSSVRYFVGRTSLTIIRTYTMYQPLKVFSLMALALFGIGAIPIVRFLVFYMQGDGAGHVQSLILGGVFVMLAFMAMMFAILADVQARNRRLLEHVLEELQEIRLGRE